MIRTSIKTKHIKPLICLVVNVAYGVNCQQIYPKWTNNASTLQCVCTNIMYCNTVELFSKTNHAIWSDLQRNKLKCSNQPMCLWFENIKHSCEIKHINITYGMLDYISIYQYPTCIISYTYVWLDITPKNLILVIINLNIQ